jgi:hypothetical protein
MTKYTFEEIVNTFEEKGCKLLTTKDEFINNNMNSKSKYKIISKCGHIRDNCNYQNFKSGSCGILCIDCAKIEAVNKIKTYNTLDIETQGINILKNIFNNELDIIILDEGTKADIGIKLKNCDNDLFLPLQLKCTLKPVKTMTKFHLNYKIYKDMFILCICISPIKFWLFDGNQIKSMNKISIGIKSKYNSNEIIENQLINTLQEKYNLNNNYLKSLEYLNTPIAKTVILEREFSNLRINQFKNINFNKSDNNLSNDFMINSYNFQEKKGTMISDNSLMFNISRYGEKINGIIKRKPYNISDNDFYWLHFPNKTKFILIPSKILCENGYIYDEINKEKIIKLNLYIPLNNIQKWIIDYIYEYNNIDTENKILTLINSI